MMLPRVEKQSQIATQYEPGDGSVHLSWQNCDATNIGGK